MAGKEQEPFVLTSYVTAEQLVADYGTTLAALPVEKQTRYNNYALNSNRAITAFLYKWVDQLPLATGTAALEVTNGMAFKYAKRLKQVDDGAVNAKEFSELYTEDKATIEQLLKSVPENVNTRRVVSNSYPDEVVPYSQSHGLSDIL